MNFDFKKYNKIIVVGCSGSGKSWLSKRIAKLTGYPIFHLDVEHWQEGWVMSSREEKIARQKQIIDGDKWIIDGNYNSTMEIRFEAADLVVFLDINRITRIISVMKRTGTKRSDLPDYLEEPKVLSREFFDFFKILWAYPKTGRKTVMALHEKYPNKIFLHIKSRGAVWRLFK